MKSSSMDFIHKHALALSSVIFGIKESKLIIDKKVVLKLNNKNKRITIAFSIPVEVAETIILSVLKYNDERQEAKSKKISGEKIK